MLAVLGLLWVGALSLTVEGETQCPRPQEVTSRLQVLAPAGSGGAMTAGRAVLTREANRLRLRLHRPDGALVGERLFEAGYRCPELAEAAALVLASWLAELGPVEVEAPVTVVAAEPETAVGDAAPVSPVAGGASYDLGLGFVAAGARSYVAGVSLSVAARRGAWGVGIEACATAFHQDALGLGVISWSRQPVMVTVRRRLGRWRRLALEAGAGLAGALLLARGEGYDVDHSSSSFDFGPIAGLHLMSGTGPLVPFLGVTAAWWPRPRALEVRPDPARRPLPQLDAWVVLGLAWRLGDPR